MSNLGFKLKKLRKSKGLTQDELAEMLCVGKTTISNYETGYTQPPKSNLQWLANFYGVPYESLIDDPDLPDTITGDTLSPQKQLREKPTINFSTKTIPVYLNLSASSLPIHHISFSTSFVGEGDIFGLKVSGDRMDRAALPDGSIAIIRSQDFADDGDILAVALEDNPAFFCRYFRHGELVVLESESHNPVYRPIVVNPKEQTFKIHGKVIKSIQSIF